MKKNDKQKAKRLFILWAASYLVCACVLGILSDTQFLNAEAASTPPIGLSQIFTTASILVYFLPLMLAVRRHACSSKWKTITTLANILIVVMVLWLVGMVVMIIAALFNFLS